MKAGRPVTYSLIVGTLVVCSVLLSAEDISAEATPSETPIYVAVAVGAGFEITCIVFATGNLIYALEGERPSSGWRTGAYIVGGINMGLGILGTIYVGVNENSLERDTWWLALAGIGVTAIGAMDIGTKAPRTKTNPRPHYHARRPRQCSIRDWITFGGLVNNAIAGTFHVCPVDYWM